MRYKNIREMAIGNKGNVVRFPAIGAEELGVKIVKKSEFENLIKLRELKSRCSAQVVEKIRAIEHNEISEVVKKYVRFMINELIGTHFSTQFKEKAMLIIDNGIDMTMEKMRLAHVIEDSLRRHNRYNGELHILAGLDHDELGPVYNGRVIRENWLKFTNQTLDSCMPGSDMADPVDPFTGYSREEQDVLDEAAREAWEEACEEDARNWDSEDDSDLMPKFDDDHDDSNDIPF